MILLKISIIYWKSIKFIRKALFMSYLKKLEEDYNNGKISLKKIDEQREFYYKLSENEKKEIDKKHGSEPNKKNISESISKDELVKDELVVDTKIWGGSSIFVGFLYSFLHMSIRSGGDLSKFYRPAEEFFMNFFVIIVVHLIFALPIWLISKGNFAKISFWTILIVSFLSLFGQAS